MSRRILSLLTVALAVVTGGLAPSGAWAQEGATSRASRGPELSVDERLDDRRYAAIGPRAYVVGTEAGRYPAMGFHTRGEMGGFWAPPIKMLDGLWFGIDETWIGPARRFTSGYGYTRMRLPATAGLRIGRTDFVPDGRRAVLVGLRIENPGGEADFVLKVDAHSELMGAYPWGETTPSQLDFNLEDEAGLRGGRLEFSETGRPHPEAKAHDWGVVVGSSLDPSGNRTGAAFRGPQDPPVICPASGEGTPPPPELCDDTAYGKGAGGQLRYRIHMEPGAARRVWFAVAGSERGLPGARKTFERAMSDPAGALDAKVEDRLALARRTRLELPGDPLLARGIEWSKQNLADSVQVAKDLAIREVDAGASYPAPEGTLDSVRFLGAGFPDYPWLFGTDGEFTAFASVGAGQFGPIKDHLRALRDVSLIDNGNSGKVVHEVVTDGSVYFGSNDDPGNTDETAKFPSAVALVWRWTGDNAFRDEMYRFNVRNMRYIVGELDADDDGWPEGLGNVERPGSGEEKLDNTVYTIRGLSDLADMAASKGDAPTARWARRMARALEGRFEAEWWMPQVPQYADSLDDPGNVKIQQRHWIGVTPMDAELVRSRRAVPGLATRRHGNRALDLRETDCYGDDFGLFHTGDAGCDPAVSDAPAEKTTFTLNTAIMAVGEGNYGRLGPAAQGRFTRANRRLQLPRPDEQPGSMPEIAPSPDYGRSIDKPFNERAQVLQAWGNYGTIWPVVHQQLGVRPDLGRGRIEVVPQVPGGGRRLAGRNIRLGGGFVNVMTSARRAAGVYQTSVLATTGDVVRVGHTIPYNGERIGRVTLDGLRVPYGLRRTNRGREVTVSTTPGGLRTVVVRTG